MLNLDELYHSYLGNKEKKFNINGNKENVIGYGYHCDGSSIVGHYITTESYKLFYDLSGQFIKKDQLVSSTK
mgnify:CR=1 FL=1|tara:strand:+ start:191 stop:406 length:216 start_codon:yes stop_codon:yes gene_type:complete